MILFTKKSKVSIVPRDSMAFTLAEVLITVAIIGVVAVITIPTLQKNIKDVQYKTAYKKVYSIAQQALIQANQQDLFVPITAVGNNPSHKANFWAFMNQFKIVKQCTNNDGNKCWDSTGEKYYLSLPEPTASSFIDESGVAWSEYSAWARILLVDTNGFAKPNQWGKDRFAFVLPNSNYNNLAAVFNINDTNFILGIPAKILPHPDNIESVICVSGNKCATEHNYYGTSWLYK